MVADGMYCGSNSLQALGDIEIAMKVLSDSGAAGDVHPIDRHYRQLGCKMELLEHSSDTFKVSYEHTSIYSIRQNSGKFTTSPPTNFILLICCAQLPIHRYIFYKNIFGCSNLSKASTAIFCAV